MPALPKPMPIDEVVAEHHAARPALVSATDPAPTVPRHMSYSATIAALRELQRCSDCGKTRAVLNIAMRGRPFRAERVTPETHCACLGGPAYVDPLADVDDYVAKVFDGAVGDCDLPFASADVAFRAIEGLLAQRFGRALTVMENVKVGNAATLEFRWREDRRRASTRVTDCCEHCGEERALAEAYQSACYTEGETIQGSYIPGPARIGGHSFVRVELEAPAIDTAEIEL